MAVVEPGPTQAGRDPFETAWGVLRAWFQDDVRGRAVFAMLVNEPERGIDALRTKLEQADVPGLSAEVTGGMLGKLVQIASAEAVHIHEPRDPVAPRLPVPAELPSKVAAFTGRGRELDQLGELLDEASRRRSTAIVVINGPAGIGKSALAVHAAHVFADRYPDGQLYVNLQGATPGLASLDPADVLGRFLRALGMDGKEIPLQTEEAAARYRSLVSSRRLLAVLDNAASAAQVRPLVPAGADCAVLITSREALSTLDGAVHLSLDILSLSEAALLLEQFIGSRRVAAERAATTTIAEQCGLLPLALRIAGARLAARPGWPLRALAERLADERVRLNELQLGDLAVRASFKISYEALRASGGPAEVTAAHIFRLLGLLEGPEVGVEVTAALADRPAELMQEVLERLVDAQLLETPAPGRYRMHDLLRLFAREHAFSDEAETDREEALHRVLRFYLATSQRASRLLQPTDPRRTVHERDEGMQLHNRIDALNWLEAERANVVAVTRQAAEGPLAFARIAIQMADALFWFCHLRVYPRDLEALNHLALAAARRLDDRGGEGQSLHNLCIACYRLRRFEDAIRYGKQSLAVRRELGDRYGEGRTLDALGRVNHMLGRFDDAIAYGEQSLAIAREISDRYSESAVLCNLVPSYQAVQRYDDAIACGEESLAIRSEIGDSYGEGRMRVSLGRAYQAAGRLDDAIACFEQSLAIFREIGDRYDEGRVLLYLGVAHRLCGRLSDAISYCEKSVAVRRETADHYGEGDALRQLGSALLDSGDRDRGQACLQAALALFEELGAADADEVRALVQGRRSADVP